MSEKIRFLTAPEGSLRGRSASHITSLLSVEQDIAKPSIKLLAPIELDSDTWVSEVKRLRSVMTLTRPLTTRMC